MVTRLLLTGGGGAGNEAIWRLLRHSYELHFADADMSAIDPSIPNERCHSIPFATDETFLSKTAELCQGLDIDLLVPGVDEELPVLAHNARRLKPTKLLLPSASYVDTMLDKQKMAVALAERGILVPSTQSLLGNLDQVHFPCICKPRSGRGSRGVSTLKDRRDAERLIEAMGVVAVDMIVQNKIEGTEYTVQMVADADGTIRKIVPVKVDVKRGITLRATIDAEPDVLAACRAIHAAIPARGCYNIQLMLTPGGSAIPFEINPRVSTTLCLVLAAGIDPFAIFLEGADATTLAQEPRKLSLRRHWHNHFY